MKIITKHFTRYDLFSNAPPDPYVQPDIDGYGLIVRVDAENEEYSDEDAAWYEELQARDDKMYTAEVRIPIGMGEKDIIVLLSQLIEWIAKRGIYRTQQ